MWDLKARSEDASLFIWLPIVFVSAAATLLEIREENMNRMMSRETSSDDEGNSLSMVVIDANCSLRKQ